MSVLLISRKASLAASPIHSNRTLSVGTMRTPLACIRARLVSRSDGLARRYGVGHHKDLESRLQQAQRGLADADMRLYPRDHDLGTVHASQAFKDVGCAGTGKGGLFHEVLGGGQLAQVHYGGAESLGVLFRDGHRHPQPRRTLHQTAAIVDDGAGSSITGHNFSCTSTISRDDCAAVINMAVLQGFRAVSAGSAATRFSER